MAEFHLHGQIIKRSEGRSAVNAAAYRAGEALYDKRLGVLFDYTRKQEVEESIILGPDHAPAWLFDREMLWNTVEAAERHRAAQLSREFDIALPVELVEKDPAAAKAALKSWARDMFVAEGLIVDINFHDMESHNPHAHIMTTMRRVDLEAMEFEAGSVYAFESTKARDQNDWGYMDFWRETWADYANAAMEEHDIDARIDHRTLIERGIDREPSIHIGPDAKAMDDRGIETDRATKNAMIWYVNAREFFEENDRYVAFLDAEAAEDRRREEERIRKDEAERKELEASAAIAARASELSDLGQSLDAAIARQISRSTKSLAEAVDSLHPGARTAVAGAQVALDSMIGVLAQRRGKIEAGLSERREEMARVEAKLQNAIRAFVDVQASRLTQLGEELVGKVEVVLGDKAVLFFEIADQLAKQKRLVLRAERSVSRASVAPSKGTGGSAQQEAGRNRGDALKRPDNSDAGTEPAWARRNDKQPRDQQPAERPAAALTDSPQASRTKVTQSTEPVAGRRRRVADKLTAAARIVRTVGRAVAEDAGMLAMSAAAVLWRPVRRAADGILSMVEGLGASVTRRFTVQRDEDRARVPLTEKVASGSNEPVPEVEPASLTHDDLFLLRLRDLYPAPFKRGGDRWVLDAARFDPWMKERAAQHHDDPLVHAEVQKAVGARTEEFIKLLGSSRRRLLMRREGNILILTEAIAQVSPALASLAEDLITHEPLLAQYAEAALERWSAQHGTTVTAPVARTQSPAPGPAKAQPAQSQQAKSASSADEEYERLRQQAAHIAANKGRQGGD